VQDISTSFKEDVSKYLNSFVPPMLELLKSQTRARDAKLSAVTALGDLAIYAPNSFC
jgi:hypothetical protein